MILQYVPPKVLHPDLYNALLKPLKVLLAFPNHEQNKPHANIRHTTNAHHL